VPIDVFTVPHSRLSLFVENLRYAGLSHKDDVAIAMYPGTSYGAYQGTSRTGANPFSHDSGCGAGDEDRPTREATGDRPGQQHTEQEAGTS